MSESDAKSGDAPGHERDVVVVGGGPAGVAAGVFTARDGLDTLVFDRGNSSIQRCAFLENYPGFPAGIDVGTFTDLLRDHIETAGCEVVADMVEAVHRRDDAAGFRVETQDGRSVTARRVVAATRYDGEYLRPLDEDEAMFEAHEHDGEVHEHFDRSYPNPNGTTPIDGLFVASPTDATDRQAIVAAGRGARAGLAVVDAVRRERGYPETLATHYDWVRRDDDLTGEWRDRDTWRDHFDGRFPDDCDLPGDRRAELRERAIDRRLDAYRTDEEIERAAERGHARLLDHVDDGLIVERAREIRAERDFPGVAE